MAPRTREPAEPDTAARLDSARATTAGCRSNASGSTRNTCTVAAESWAAWPCAALEGGVYPTGPEMYMVLSGGGPSEEGVEERETGPRSATVYPCWSREADGTGLPAMLRRDPSGNSSTNTVWFVVVCFFCLPLCLAALPARGGTVPELWLRVSLGVGEGDLLGPRWLRSCIDLAWDSVLAGPMPLAGPGVGRLAAGAATASALPRLRPPPRDWPLEVLLGDAAGPGFCERLDALEGGFADAGFSSGALGLLLTSGWAAVVDLAGAGGTGASGEVDCCDLASFWSGREGAVAVGTGSTLVSAGAAPVGGGDGVGGVGLGLHTPSPSTDRAHF